MALKDSTKFRFVLVGGLNTTIDFSVLFILKSLGLPAIGANIISTATAFCFSFFANKKYTFKANGDTKRQIVSFILVNLFGLWVLQTIIIQAVSLLLTPANLSPEMTLLIAKLIATIATLIWNYFMYSRVVFKPHADNRH